MNGPQRLNLGPALLALGAAALLVSLFLDWFKPGLTAWTSFELVDLLLALIAVGALLAVFARAVPSAGVPALSTGRTTALAAAGLLLVLLALVNHPPAAVGRSLDTGIWIALAGAVLMTAGAALDAARISFTVTFSPREPARREREPQDESAGEPETRPMRPEEPA
ncbi:MAG: hypothetical protein GEU88_13260 [Solirubrobacterales bacterium]|nr:hypothetical protein [Solirubrobacterales bacterium]